MKHKVKQNTNVINLYLVSRGANNCTRNEITVQPIRWISVLLFEFPQALGCKPPVSLWRQQGPDQDGYKGHGKAGGSFLRGRAKRSRGTVPNRKPTKLLWTGGYAAEALFSWSGDIYSDLLFLVFYHSSTKIHLEWNVALKDMVQECEGFCQKSWRKK